MARYRYLLGDSSVEAARLRAQARLWDPVARALFDRLGVRRGWRVLEVGPGQGSLHLELRRRVGGPVDAVERSPAFARRLERLCARDGLGSGTIWSCDLERAPLPRAAYDLIFARWVFLFLPRPLEHLKLLARALKPGGVLAVEDYQRETMALIPRPPEWDDFLAADLAFFASEGGDASAGARLPGLCRRAGLRVEEIRPEIKLGRPRDAVWTWLSTYFLGVMKRYGRQRPFTPAKAERLRRAWLQAQKDKTSLLIAPCVLDVVARKSTRVSGSTVDSLVERVNSRA